MTSTTAPSLRQDAQVITLVGVAHGVSHFFHLILAPLFPWLKAEFGLSYAELGLLMTVFFVVSGIGQASAGFVVDRVGARAVLFAGMAVLGLSALALSLAQNYPMLLAGAMLAGLGNCVFHPADLTLLNKRVSTARLGHAFSVHGISGNLGWAAAPVFMAGIAGVAGWRTALVAAAFVPFAWLAVLFAFRGALQTGQGDAAAGKQAGAAHAESGALSFIRLPAVWMCFGYFFITALALAGIQSFSAAGLRDLYDMSLASATVGQTAYMLSSAVGMVLGGFVAAKAARHDRTIAMAFGVSGLCSLLIAAAFTPGWMAVLLMGAVGFGAGLAGPSRDLLIRAAAPRNATGRVYGVVYSGLDTGLACGPLLFGVLMDGGQPALMFVLIGVFQAMAILTAVNVGANTARRTVTQAA